MQTRLVQLGAVRVRSGLLAVSDPFVCLDDPVIVPIRRGSHRVVATIADVSDAQDWSHAREAYLSLLLDGASSVAVEGAPTVQGTPERDRFYGVAVDSGTVAFTDARAIRRGMPRNPDDWYESVFDTDAADSWFAQMDADVPLPSGLANVRLPRARFGQNLVLCHSGWGDGFYPLVRTLAADGTVTGIHIDLLVTHDEAGDDRDGALQL